MQEIPGSADQLEPDHSGMIRKLSRPLYEARTWMQFSGIVLILMGAACAITIWGIIFCWIPIWLGVLLIKSASGMEAAHEASDADSLLQALKRLKTGFIILGILMALELLGAVIGLFVMGGLFIAGLSEL